MEYDTSNTYHTIRKNVTVLTTLQLRTAAHVPRFQVDNPIESRVSHN